MNNLLKPKIFISYSHKDEEWKDLIKIHFSSTRKFEVWNDRDIKLGVKWYEDIENSINETDIAILLISKDFLNSEFIMNEEIPRLLKRCEDDNVKVVTVQLEPCSWEIVDFLSGYDSLQGYPRDNKPLSSFIKVNEVSKENSHGVNEEIKKLVQGLYQEFQENSLKVVSKTTFLPSPLNSFTQQKEDFLTSVKNTTFDLTKEEFYTIASKYISNQTYLDKVEHQKSLYMMIETLYESSQKEDLASILHDLSDKIEFNESFNSWVEEHYNPDNEQLKEMVNEKKDEEHIFVEIHHKSGLEYNVSIYPRYRKGSKSPKHFLLEDISSKASQELFLSQFRGLKLDIPIHLIIPESLYLENFRLWLKRNRSLIHLANPLYLHSLERYHEDVDDYDWMIEQWEDRFVSTHKLKDSLHLLDSEEVIYIGKDKEENRLIGVCYGYQPSTIEEIYDDLDLAYISLWSHPTESEYHQKIIDKFDTIPLNRLPQMVKDCQHLSLLWDDMRMLYGLKKELTQ